MSGGQPARCRRRIVAGGRVQGVCFRVETRARARSAGVAGWVRNRPDGRVEAVFEGPPEAVDALVAFCRKGPPGARVDALDVREEPPEGLAGFDVRAQVVLRIVSGGQTGVDRAALEAAREAGLLRGGWCPRGRRAEDGPLPDDLPLRETPEADPAQRTAWNVRDSDGTLVLLWGAPRGGTALTLERAAALGRPALALDLAEDADPAIARAWVARHRIRTLNVAGPRESEAPGVQARAQGFLRRLLAAPATDRDDLPE